MREYGDAHHPEILKEASRYVYGKGEWFKEYISDIMSDSYAVYAWWEVPILILEALILVFPLLASLPFLILLLVFKGMNEAISGAIWRRYDELKRKAYTK